MAHLTDMEELLARIPNADVRDHMREAMHCYMAGAYRGSLVLSYIALFDDLLAKLGELANVSTTAKTVFLEATKRRTDQDVYENYLIDQLTSGSLITRLDSSFLTTLRTLRNKSAHPSGHKPSPEEARYIFFETIDRFLSKPILSTTHLVDDIVGRLKNTNFFPGTEIRDTGNVVRDETASLHAAAIPQLVAKLVTALTSADTATSQNARLFLTGLAMLDNAAANAALRSKLVKPKADDNALHDLLIQVLSANGKLFCDLDQTTIDRIRGILAAKISNITSTISETKLTHPTTALVSLASALSEQNFLTTFKPELEALFTKRAHSEFVVKLVRERPSLLDIYLPILLANAGSSDFATANAFSNAVDKLDEPLGKLLTDEQAFQLTTSICVAARTGAWSAKAAVGAKFAGTPSLRAKTLAYIAANEAAASAYITAQLDKAISISAFVAENLTDE